MAVRAIRGAITVEKNEREEILQATQEMLEEAIRVNDVCTQDMVCMIFTLTPDLNDVFPAVAARNMGITNVPLMCMSEIPVDGALKKCIRIMMLVNTEKGLEDMKHVYLKDAVTLRPDLAK